jgi:hypothetical protein
MSADAVTPLRLRIIEDMNARKLGAHSQRSHIYSCRRFAARPSLALATCPLRLDGHRLYRKDHRQVLCDAVPALALVGAREQRA